MTTIIEFSNLSESERRQIRMYGVTVEQMREAVEESLTFRFSGPAMYAMSMISDAQEMIAYTVDLDVLLRTIEDQRQLLNRAKWILSTYVHQSPDVA